MSGNSGEEDHTWPAFVDALTALAMILTFVMMILAVGMAAMSQNVSKIIVDSISEVINRTPRPGQPPVSTVEDITRAIEQMQRATPIQTSPVESERRLQTNDTVERQADARPTTATRSQSVLTLTFQPRQHRVDAAASEEIKKFLEESQEARSARVLEIRAPAVAASGALSEARRLAYYRAMVMRAELLRNGVAPNRVVVMVDERLNDAEPETVRVFAKP